MKRYEGAKTAGEKFTDNQFYPQCLPLGIDEKMLRDVDWIRPEQIFKGNFKLFDGIDPSGIKQGQLGASMLATISALASDPKNIERLFVLYDLEVGFYVLKFYKNGKPEYLVIDDKIPCHMNISIPFFLRSSRN